MDKRPVSGISPQNGYAENYYQYKKWFFALKTFFFFLQKIKQASGEISAQNVTKKHTKTKLL